MRAPQDTRRRVRQSELALDGADRILDALVAARLVVVHEGAVEIAHEALIGAWPRLRQWLTDDRDSLLSHRQLTEATLLWEELERDPSALLRGTRLAVAGEWAQRDRHDQALTPNEKAFLSAGQAAEQAETAAAGRRTRQLQRLSFVLTALLACAALAAGVAVWQWDNATAQTRLATSRDLASHALRVGPTDVSQAMRLSLDAYATAQTADARGALLSIASRPSYTARLPHSEPVKEVAFSPDATVLIAATQDPAPVVWDVRHRTVLARLTGGHTAAVRAVAVGPNHLVVSGSLDGSVVLWDYAKAKELKVLRPKPEKTGPHDYRVESVAISPDGSVVAVSARERPTELWRLPDGAPLGTLADQGDNLTRVAFSPDGTRLVSAAPVPTTPADQVVTLWEVATRTVLKRSPALPEKAQSVAYSPDGHTIAIASELMADVALWDTGTDRLSFLKGHTQTVRQVAFSPDGTRLVSGGFDEFAIVWDVQRQLAITRLFGHSSELYTVAYTPDGRTIATGSRDRQVLLFDAAEQPFTGHVNRINGVAVSPDGKLLASASKDTTVIVWETATRRPVKVLTGNSARVVDVTFSPDGKLLASASDDRTFRVWDTTTWTERSYSEENDFVLSVSFSPDGKLLAAAYPKTVVVMEVDTGRFRYTLPMAKSRYTKAIFGHDRQTLFFGHEDGTIVVHDLTAGDEFTLQNAASVNDLSVDRTGTLLAVGTPEGEVTLWNLTDRTSRSVPNAHSGQVSVVRFSPDGRFLASTGADQNVDLWDVTTLKLWARLTGHEYDIQGMAFGGEGQTLYTGSIDQTITAWVLDPARAIATICADLRENFHVAKDGCS